MDRETKSGYEPDRIPPSVFASTITPKQDWSVQSNESLFSIHMGDQSFSTMYKSGELTNFEYSASYINNNNNNYNNTNIDHKITSTDARPGETIPKTVPKQDEPQQISPAKSYRPDTSNNSGASFAFPTLPEYQQDRKKSLNVKSESGKTDISRPDSKPGLYPDDSKRNGGGWLSCFFCFPVKN